MENKIGLDINKIRAKQIEMHNLTGVDEKYNFYYDETNNIRKLLFKETGILNINACDLNKDFVLGGIVDLYDSDLIDQFCELKLNLKSDKSIKEIKFKHIAKGRFLDCLKSNKLTIFLNWITDNKLKVHYSNINILYWSIVDIVDSFAVNHTNFNYAFINEIKTCFYEIVKLREVYFISLLYRYQYPNIKREKIKQFINELRLFILEANENSGNYNFIVLMLVDLINICQHKELVFIQGYKEYQLIETFTNFYINRLTIFKNSKHVFDEEVVIMNDLDSAEICDGDIS